MSLNIEPVCFPTTLDHAKARFIDDLVRFRGGPGRYTPAMAWEKLFSRRETVSFAFDGPVWAWGRVFDDRGEPGIQVDQDRFFGHRTTNHCMWLVEYLHLNWTSAEWLNLGDMMGIDETIDFCLQTGLWIGSEFLIRVTFEGRYDYWGEYDEDWEWLPMYATPPVMTPEGLAYLEDFFRPEN